MPYSSTVSQHLKAGLKRISDRREGVAVHFLIVRPTGPKDTPRMLFGRRADQVLPDPMKRLYKADATIKGSNPQAWFKLRGVAVLEDGGWVVLPAYKDNKVLDPTSFKTHMRETKIELIRNGLQGGILDTLIAAAFGKAVDTNRFVDTTPEEELPPPEVEEEDAEQPDEEEVAPPPVVPEPVNLLAMDAPPDVVSLAGVRALVLQFAQINLRDGFAQRARVEGDAGTRQDALNRLDQLHRDLTDIDEAARRFVVSAPLASRESGIPMARELLARVGAALQKVEDDRTHIAPPLTDLDGLAQVQSARDRDARTRALPWLQAQADRLKRIEGRAIRLNQPARLQELGDQLHSGNIVEMARARGVFAQVQEMKRELTEAQEDLFAKEKENGGLLEDLRYEDQRPSQNALRAAYGRVFARLETIEPDASARGLASRKEDPSKDQRTMVRRRIQAELVGRPKVIDGLMKVRGGPAQIDAMVRDLGSKVSSPEDKRFLKAALEARFQCSLSGDMTKKALPRLYQLLSSVPDSHTTHNPKLAEIIRKKITTPTDSGTYAHGVLTVSTGKTGLFARSRDQGQGAATKNVKAFDLLTLHELGHAVDDKMGFMTAKGNNALTGGWRPETADSVATVLYTAGTIGAHLALVDLSEAQRKDVLAWVLKNKEAEAEKLVTAALWPNVKDHPDLQRARRLRAQDKPSGKGTWFTEAEAKKEAVDGRVYQEAYMDKWFSYALAARDRQVRDYQFRAPGEWFAEVYAAYYLGTLEPGGKEQVLIRDEVHAV